jgi:hypothetical protein
LRLARQNPPDSSTAFRLPISLLRAVDQWCDQNDITRSQFFRRCVVERIKALGVESMAHAEVQTPQATGEQRQWSEELYDRLKRHRQ